MQPMRAVRALSLLLAGFTAVACDTGSSASTTAATAATPAPAATMPAAATHKPRLVPAPAGGRVAEIVAAEQGSAGARQLVVYVGAAWCEPCVAFHDALTTGQLDADLPGVRFLEFDLDRDRPRLEADGYSSRLVPLFAIPGPDGRASGAQIQGGVTGAGAAANLVARLKPLLAATSGT